MKLDAVKIRDYIGLAGDLTVSGKIVRVYDKKSGKSEKGDWSFQGFVLNDGKADMNCTLKNRPDSFSKQDVGKTITITSHHTDKGWFGVKVEEDSYEKDGQTKTSVKVIITKSASFAWAEGSAPQNAGNPGGVTRPEDMEDPGGIAPSEVHPPVESVTSDSPETPAPQPDMTLEQLRTDTIWYAVQAWKSALADELKDTNHPAYKEIWSAMILAAGRNADTLFIAKRG